MSGKTTIGYRIKDTADPEVPYAIHANFGHGWEWFSRSGARGRWMSRDVARATLAKMLAWAETDDGVRFRAWNVDDLRVVKIVRKGGWK